MDNRREDFIIKHLALAIDVHFASHGQSVHARIQATNAIG